MEIKLAQKIKELEERVAVLEAAILSRPIDNSPTAKQQSPKELLLSKAPKSVAQKTLLLAYYAERTGQEACNVGDLAALFRAAKEKPPTNINDMVNKNIAKGYMMEHISKKNGKKAWVLTSTGEQIAEAGAKRVRNKADIS